MLTSSLQFRQRIHSEKAVSVPQKSIIRSKAYASLTFVLSDSVSILTSFFIIYYLFNVNSITYVPHFISFKIFVLSSTCLLLSNYFIGLYPGYGIDPVDELRSLFYGTLLTTSLIIFFCMFKNCLTFQIILFQIMFSFVLFTSAATTRRYLRKILLSTKWWGIPAILYGSAEDVRIMFDALQKQKEIGLNPRVFIESDENDFDFQEKNSDIEAIEYIGKNTNIDHLILALTNRNADRVKKDIDRISNAIKKISLVTDVSAIGSLWISSRNLNILYEKSYFLSITQKTEMLKNIFDKIFSMIFLLISSPLFILSSIVILLESKGCILFQSIRVGKNGRLFNILKFRTMVENAENVLDEILRKNPDLKKEYYKYRKLNKDPRVTKFGSFLRKYYIDEIPQFINVFRGDMALVGSRPFLIKEIEQMGDNGDSLTQMRPGLTGLWQITDSYSASHERRIIIDKYYIRNWSFFLDIFILAKTISWVFKGKGL
jgi:Undecaprenyl-phosphate galactose phosphotransferase WbaP